MPVLLLLLHQAAPSEPLQQHGQPWLEEMGDEWERGDGRKKEERFYLLVLMGCHSTQAPVWLSNIITCYWNIWKIALTGKVIHRHLLVEN